MKRQLRYFSIIIICSLIAAWFPLNGAAQEIGDEGSGYLSKAFYGPDPCCVDSFREDNSLPRLKLEKMENVSHGDSSTVIIDSVDLKQFEGYHHFFILIQRATDSFFTDDLDCRRWEADTTATGYQNHPDSFKFRNLPAGRDIYYRAFALATRDSDGVPVRGLASNIVNSFQSADKAHCYPNPFNPNSERTIIVLRTKCDRNTKLRIFDLYGNLVIELGEKNFIGGGNYWWNGRNGHGDVVAPGGYIAIPEGSKEKESWAKIAVKY